MREIADRFLAGLFAGLLLLILFFPILGLLALAGITAKIG